MARIGICSMRLEVICYLRHFEQGAKVTEHGLKILIQRKLQSAYARYNSHKLFKKCFEDLLLFLEVCVTGKLYMKNQYNAF